MISLQFLPTENILENISRETGEENSIKEFRKFSLKQFLNLPQEKSEIFKKNTFPFTQYLESEREINKPKFEISGINYSTINGKEILIRNFDSAKDKMIAFVNSFFNSGFFLEIPNNSKSQKIKVSTIIPKNSISISQNIVVVGENSEVEFENDLVDESEHESVYAANILFLIKGNSSVTLNNFQNIDVNKKIFLNVKFICEKDSKVLINSQNFGAGFVRNKNEIILRGDGASAKNFEILLENSNQKYDITTDIKSIGRFTRGETFTKGVFSENSKGVIKGKIEVQKGAKRSDTYLAQHGMLVGKNSEANTIPCLEIIEEDVARATHSASVSKMDEDQLFYLMSRGLSELDAKNLIVFAFLSGNLKNIDEKKREQISEVITRKIGESIAS